MRRVGASRETARWCGGDRTPRVLVVGCGLIGGSVALAVRRRHPRTHVAVVDRPSVTRRAVASRVAKAAFTIAQLERALGSHQPHVVVLASPIDGVLSAIERIALSPVAKGPLVLDTGSVKGSVVRRARACQCPRFIGGHPMAGRETQGLEAAQRSLFDERPFVLCPATGSRSDLAKARAFVRDLGATPQVLSAEDHDRIVALTSHVPHIAAWTLMSQVTDKSKDTWRLAAGSWRDATRVAMSDERVWAPILEHNRDAIVGSLDGWIEALAAVRDGLVAGTPAGGLEIKRLGRLRRALRRFLP